MVGVQLAEAVFVSAPRAQLAVKRIRQGHQGKLRVPAHMQVGSLRRIGRDGQRHTTVNRLIIIEEAIDREGTAGDSDKGKKKMLVLEKTTKIIFFPVLII